VVSWGFASDWRGRGWVLTVDPHTHTSVTVGKFKHDAGVAPPGLPPPPPRIWSCLRPSHVPSVPQYMCVWIGCGLGWGPLCWWWEEVTVEPHTCRDGWEGNSKKHCLTTRAPGTVARSCTALLRVRACEINNAWLCRALLCTGTVVDPLPSRTRGRPPSLTSVANGRTFKQLAVSQPSLLQAAPSGEPSLPYGAWRKLWRACLCEWIVPPVCVVHVCGGATLLSARGGAIPGGAPGAEGGT
jgi:hypothetical protein